MTAAVSRHRVLNIIKPLGEKKANMVSFRQSRDRQIWQTLEAFILGIGPSAWNILQVSL